MIITVKISAGIDNADEVIAALQSAISEISRLGVACEHHAVERSNGMVSELTIAEDFPR